MDGLTPIDIQILIDNPGLLRTLSQGERDVQNSNNKISQKAKETSAELDSFMKKAAQAAAGYFSIAAAKSFVQQLIVVRGQFEQLQVAYTTILGSKQKADALFAETVKLAQTTPFSLTEVATSTKQLLAYGFSADEVTGTLSKLGDVAAGVSAPIGDIAYLYGTLRVQGRAYAQDIRQFTGRGIPIIQELAKQFDTTESNVNSLVEAGKVGFPEIEKAFNSITGAGGQFFNLMEAQSKTVTGQVSNLGDAFDQMLNDIGKSNESLITGGISAASSLVHNYQTVIDIIETLIVTYGAYKAAVLTTNAFSAFNAARQVTESVLRFNGAIMVTTEVTRTLSVAQTLQAGAANVANKANALLNATMLANPYVALTVGLAAMAVALYNVNKSTDYAAKASQTYFEALGKEQFKLGELFQALEDTKAGTEERRKSVVAIKDAYGEYLPKMDLEKANLADIRKAYQLVNEKITENIALKSKAEQTQSISEDFNKQYADIVSNLTNEIGDKLGQVQAGRAAVAIGKLLAQAQAGKILLGAGMRGRFDGGIEANDNALKYRQQLSGRQNSDKVVGLKDYMSQLQSVVDKQRAAKASLEAFYKGAEEVTKTNTKELSAAQKAALLFVERLKEPVKNFDLLLQSASSKGDLDKLKKALEDKVDSLAPNDGQISAINERVKKVKDAIAKYDPSTQAKQANAFETEFQKRQRLFDKVGELQQQTLTNAKSADQQEIDQAKAKYEKLLNEIAEYNRKAKIKINPAAVKLADGSVINVPKLEQQAADDVSAKQRVKKQQEVIDSQKELFDQFEAYKKEVGEKSATAVYESGLKGFKSYVAYLEGQLAGLDGKTDAYSNAYRDVLNKELPKAQLDESKQQAQRFIGFLSAAQTYENQRNKIIAEGIQTAADLRAKGYNDEAIQAQVNAQKQLTTLDESHIKELDAYKELFDGVVEISNERAKQDISALRKYIDNAYKSGTLTKEAYESIKKMLKDADTKVKSSLPEGLRAVANQLGNIANQVGRFDSALGNVLNTVGSVLSGVADVKANFNALNDIKKLGKADLFGSITSGLGILSAGIGIISTIGGLFSNSQRDAEQRQYASDMQLKAIEATNKALERQIALTKELYGSDRLDSYKKDLLDIAQAQQDTAAKLQGKLTLSGWKEFDEAIAKYNNGEKYNEMVWKPLIEGYKAGGKSIDLTTQSLEQLTKLMDEGKLDEKTSAIVQSLLSLQQQAKDTANALKEEVTGTSFDSLKDAISSIFESGETDAASFAKAIEKEINKALYKAFERKNLEKYEQSFFDALYNAGLDGTYTDAEIAALRAQKEELAKNLEKQAEAYKEIVGNDPNKDIADASTMAGAIKGITAEQANILEGTTRGIQLQGERKIQLMSDQLGESRKQTLIQIEIAASTKRTADNTDLMRDSLKNIDKNTTDATGAILRGAGII